jgi:histidinol-phosphatase (PHP family)
MYDYHTHSVMSSDGRDGIDEMISAALAAGLDEYALTDHNDYDYKDPSISFDLDTDAYFSALSAVAERFGDGPPPSGGPGIPAARSGLGIPGGRSGPEVPGMPVLPGADRPFRFVRGIEIGMQLGETNLRNAELVRSYDFDFVLASVHCAWDCAVDIPEYYERRDPETAARDYYDYTLKCLEEYDDFDVLGHLNFIDRFAPRIPKEDEVWEHADAVIRKLVDKGKGMEVNSKIFRVLGHHHSTPTLRMLKRYAELGGETVTTGSDAHSTEEVGAGLKEAEELIRAAGLRYIATFRDRKVSYVAL